MLSRALQPTDLLGPLNDAEQKYAPRMLYVIGRTEVLKRRPRISIVGSRQPSKGGLDTAAHLAGSIAKRGGVVVSGLARGIDVAAHQGTLDAGGATAAVLGTPLNRFYPKENEALQRRLMDEQLVVSQFAEGHDAGRKGFVMRNRTMALLTDATVIIEAGEQSGTQHQGWEAIRLGRTLYLPLALVEASFDWPQKMLDYGAVVYADVSQLEDLLALDFLMAELDDDPLSAAPF